MIDQMPDQRLMKLGKRPYVYDRRHLQLARYLNLTVLPPVPDSFDFTPAVSDWGMDGNDTAGDCPFAGADHQEKLWNGYTGKPYSSTADQVVKVYSQQTGYVPGDPNTDNGAYLIDVLKMWQQQGFLGHKIDAFVQVATADLAMVRAALYLFGGLYAGVALPLSAQNAQVWDCDGNYQGDKAPGSWGGHCVILASYDQEGFNCVTWGTLQYLTTAFLNGYFDELWAIISMDWLLASGKTLAGFDMDQLKADLAAVKMEAA